MWIKNICVDEGEGNKCGYEGDVIEKKWVRKDLYRNWNKKIKRENLKYLNLSTWIKNNLLLLFIFVKM